jgi:hypothetical protein
MENIRIAVDSVIEALGLADSIGRVYLEMTDSPWTEKVLVKRKKEHPDVKLTVWHDNLYLYGRIYRLLLYVYDMLDPDFGYNSKKVPKEEGEAAVRELYTQIWSIYVDSRVERNAIPNFYDRTMRRNLFVDARKDLTWAEAFALFDELWGRKAYTHQEITEYARSLDEAIASGPSLHAAPEVEINAFLKEHSVSKHLERIASAHLKETAHEVINFTAYSCKGTIIRSSYYGIRFEYEKRLIGEMIPMATQILLTVPEGAQKARTFTITDASDAREFQDVLRDAYKTYADAVT